MEKRQFLGQMLLEKWLFACRKLKLDSCVSPCTNVNSKWIKDLNIRPGILQLVQESTGVNSKWIKDLNIRTGILQLVQERARNTLETIGIGKDFLSRIHVSQQLRERMDRWDYVKLKSICTEKELVS
jgi:hypothetical protein